MRKLLQVGSGVLDFTLGQRVVAIAPERCGGLATRISLDAEDVWLLPSEVSTRDAAALVYGHSTALLAFTEKRPIDGTIKASQSDRDKLDIAESLF